MTVKEIKKEAKERFVVGRFKAMPIYSMVYFVVVNIIILTALFLVFAVGAENLRLFLSIVIGCYGFILLLLTVCLGGAVSFCTNEFFLRIAYSEKPSVDFAASGFKPNNFARATLSGLFKFFVTLLLTCLLIVPGIIFAIKTSLSYYKMSEDKKVGVLSSARLSSKAMKGHSGLYFKLGLSFIGWFLLCIATLGIGFIYVMPYFGACKAVFYRREVMGGVQGREESSGDEEYEPVETDASVSDGNRFETEVVTVEETPVVEAVAETDDVETDGQEAAAECAPIEDKNEPVQTEEQEPIIIVASDVAQADQAEHVQAEEPKKETATPVVANSVRDEESEKNATKEAIRQRIEQLKRERNKHGARPQKPEPRYEPSASKIETKPKVEQGFNVTASDSRATAEKKPAAQPGKKSDEFAPEIIEVEIVEDE